MPVKPTPFAAEGIRIRTRPSPRLTRVDPGATMPRYALPLLLAIALVIALVLTWWTLGRSPSASEGATVDRDVEPFHAVSISGAADVVLQHGEAEHVSIEAPARGARVTANVRDGT